MKKRIFLTAFAIAIAVSMSLTAHAEESRAEKIEKIAQDVYHQLITERKLEATFESDFALETEDLRALEDQLWVYMDDPDELFDAETLYLNMQIDEQIAGVVKKGTHYYTWSGGSTAYDIQEADELTDRMAEEILAECSPNANNVEKLCRMAHYLWSHYAYNYDYTNSSPDKERGKRGDPSLYNNIVKAYYEDPHTITCNGFASLAYVVGRKIGLECEYIWSENHVFNAIKLDGNDRPIAVDITVGSIAGVPIWEIMTISSTYGMGGRFTQVLNEGKEYRYAKALDIFRTAIFNIKTYGALSPYGKTGRLLDLLMLGSSALTLIIMAIVIHLHEKRKKRLRDKNWINKETFKDLPI